MGTSKMHIQSDIQDDSKVGSNILRGNDVKGANLWG